jgi:hypothetical protein
LSCLCQAQIDHFFPNVFWFWWNAIGAVVTISVGVVLGLLLSGSRETRTPVAAPGGPVVRGFPLRESIVMLIVFICILVICALLPKVSWAANGANDSFQLTATQKDFELYFPTYPASMG